MKCTLMHKRIAVAEMELDDATGFIQKIGRPTGCLKVNEAAAQTEAGDPYSLEIERIYVAKEFQGTGLGSRLMDEAVRLAAEQKKAYIWLGVWEKNERAIRFYEGKGFYRTGSHTFTVGNDEQTDYIMRKDLSDAGSTAGGL